MFPSFEYHGKDYFRNAFPLSVTIGESKAESVPCHAHDFTELVIIRQGVMSQNVNFADGTSISYSLAPGDIFAILPGESHSYQNSRGIHYYNILFDRELLQPWEAELRQLPAFLELFESQGRPRNKLHLSLPGQSNVFHCLQELLSELGHRQPGFAIMARNAFLEMLVAICRNQSICAPDKVASSPSNRLLDIQALLVKHPFDSYSMPRLARQCAMSTAAFYAHFHALTGMAPHEYLVSLRITHAMELLLNTTRKIGAIALDCGFCDSNHFIKTFRAFNGITPMEYRRQFML